MNRQAGRQAGGQAGGQAGRQAGRQVTQQSIFLCAWRESVCKAAECLHEAQRSYTYMYIASTLPSNTA